MPVRRRQSGPWPAIQQAFHTACLQAGFGTTSDKNGLHPAGLGVTPSNNLDGIRISTALTHLNPVHPYLNPTVRGGVLVRRIVVKDGKAVAVQAESGGKVFRVEADRLVLSAGAIRSPHLLMLSGIGLEDQLQQFGIPIVRHLPGVGQNLWNHLSAEVMFKVKDGISIAAQRDAAHFSLHYTAPGSSAVNDMVLRTSPVIDERQEHVPGLRTRYPTGAVLPEQAARISCMLGLPDGSGYVRLASAPMSSRPFITVISSVEMIFVAWREGVRMAAKLLESNAFQEVADHRIHSADDILATAMLWISGSAKPWGRPGTYQGLVRWDWTGTQWRSSTNTAE
jgi:choline dehydrogenase